VRATRAGDRRARDLLVERELPLVRRVASRYRGIGLPDDDLVQEGALGVLDAVEQFDPERAVDFDAYARFRAQRAIRNALTDRARLLRLPKHIVERRHALARAEAEAVAATGRPATFAELAERTGLSLPAVVEAWSAPREPRSLDAPVLPDGTPLEALIEDAGAEAPDEHAVRAEEMTRVGAAVARLPGRQRYAVEHVFGFTGPAESFATVAAALRLSPPRTRAIVTDALERLRDELDP